MGDFIVIVLLIVIMLVVIYSLYKNRHKGCNGECGSCTSACHVDWDEIHKKIKNK